MRDPIYMVRIRFGNDLSDSFEHLRFIDDYIFQDCDKLVKERASVLSDDRTRNLRSTSQGLLTGIVYCGSCGGQLAYHHIRTTRTLADGTKRVYERDVYRCYRRVSNHNGCKGQVTYNLEKIDEAVLTVARGYFKSIFPYRPQKYSEQPASASAQSMATYLRRRKPI